MITAYDQVDSHGLGSKLKVIKYFAGHNEALSMAMGNI